MEEGKLLENVPDRTETVTGVKQALHDAWETVAPATARLGGDHKA